VNDVVFDFSFVVAPDVPSQDALVGLIHKVARTSDEFRRYPDEMRIALYEMLLDYFMQPGHLKSLTSDLTDQEMTAIVLRFGLRDGIKFSQAKVRAQLSISLNRLRRVEYSSALKMGQKLRSMDLLETFRDEYLQHLLDKGDLRLSSLELSPQAVTFLSRNGFFTVNQLVRLSVSDLARDDQVVARHFKFYLPEIRRALSRVGVALQGEKPVRWIR